MRDYDTSINATYGTGSSPKYLGGFLGIKAYLDAMNPWDFVKAAARGFRWLFVGYRHRTKDPSYAQAGKIDTVDGYTGIAQSGHGTELHPTLGSPPRAHRTAGMAEDDRTGLLQNPAALAQTQSRGHSPYRKEQDLNWPLSNTSQPDVSTYPGYPYGKAPSYDSSYHGQTANYSSHPALQAQRGTGTHDPNWEMFAGAGRPTGGFAARPNQHDQDYPARF